jgi:4-alpha-glucanotransferase
VNGTPISAYSTGLLLPLSALRSENNLGVGEFADLPALARWCRDLGLDLIQLLPVNDTGSESSPYSALSAFALHPLYLRISDLPELADLAADTQQEVSSVCQGIRSEHEPDTRMRYQEFQRRKLEVARLVFDRSDAGSDAKGSLARFAEQNPWVRGYAVFKVLKSRSDERSWREWTDHRDPDDATVQALWEQPEVRSDALFHVWMQLRLEEQFAAASAEVGSLGLLLKGDLPILMNDDSADVWLHRDMFHTNLRAGAPPDMFTARGQNWDLPVYNWDRMARDEYSWWRARLSQAAKFYSAYRIDHVLGFFRVWAIPAANHSGLLGHFVPAVSATTDRLHGAGFDDGRIRWLAEPHLRGDEVRAAFGTEADTVIHEALSQIDGEDLYLFADGIRGERDILRLDVSERAKEWLLAGFADRSLLPLEDGSFSPSWNFRGCSRYASLSEGERGAFEHLVGELGRESESLWESQGRTLLGFMRGASEMLPCAEDLGVIPAAVPRVLADLRILGLRIPRWARLWDQPRQPYIPPAEYPFLTVCAPSVHDTSTMRGWWEEDDDKQAFWSALGLDGAVPATYDPQVARRVIEAVLRTGSSICVLQLQDLLALTAEIPEVSVDEERVNVPGTVNEFNWGYRMPVPVPELAACAELASVLSPLLAERRARPVMAN